MKFKIKRFEELTKGQIICVKAHHKECIKDKSMMCSDLHKDIEDFYYAHAEMDFPSFAVIEDTPTTVPKESDDEILNEDVWNFIQTHKNDKRDGFGEWLFNQSFKPTDKVVIAITEYNTCKEETQKYRKEETKIIGQLEIDVNMRVIWFNSNEGLCRLRIYKLTDAQIDDLLSGMLDITIPQEWKKCSYILPTIPAGYSCNAPETHKCTTQSCPCWSIRRTK